MRISNVLLVLIAAAIAMFAMLNWNTITTPAILDLGIATVQAPLGLVMLGLLILFVISALVFVVYAKTAGLFRERHHAREMQAAQNLAENAEESRFVDLRNLIAEELKALEERNDERMAAMMAKLDHLEKGLGHAMEQLPHG